MAFCDLIGRSTLLELAQGFPVFFFFILCTKYSLLLACDSTVYCGLIALLKCNALNSIQFRLMLFRALLMLLIPNTTVNCAITYTNSAITDYRFHYGMANEEGNTPVVRLIIVSFPDHTFRTRPRPCGLVGNKKSREDTV